MPKNKNTNSAADRNNPGEHRAADVLVVLFCLAGMSVCLWLFRQDLYGTLSRLNVKPVGTVILKRRIAQRRFENRVLWDNLQKTTPVYSGDFIRTAERSGAIITLIGDDTVANLDENTIIQITTVKETGESRINLFDGSASVTAGSGGAVFSSGNDTLVLAPGSTASAAAGSIGSAAAGPVMTGAFPAGPPPRLIVPANREAFSGNEGSGEISFRWTADDDDRIVLYLLEVADNPAMENAAVTMRVSGKRVVLSPLETGRWYWRVTPVYAGNFAVLPSAVASFSIGETVPAVSGAAVPAVTEAGGEAADPGPGGAGREGEQPGVQNTAALQTIRSAVSPNAASGQSAAAMQVPALSPPREMRPGNGYVLGPAELRASRTIAFSWNPVSGAAGYVFSLYRETDGERQRIEAVEVKAAGYVFTGLNLLERGTFVWTVQALRAGSDGSLDRGDPAESRFVVDIPVLQRRELPETGILYGD
jgi:hypothetical protein